MAETRRGFGIAAALPREVVVAVAQQVEALGYYSLWVNDTPDGDGLAALSHAAGVTGRIRLGVGVIPLSRRTPESIIEETRQLRLPLDRLQLGVGSGSGPYALSRVRAGVRAVSGALDTQVFVAALGPKMSRLAGAEADGVLFNWLTPDWAHVSVGWVREAAQQAGRRPPILAAYVRTALGADARGRLAREAQRYTAVPAYGDHFQRMGTPAFDTAVTGETPAEIQAGLAAWEGVLDEVVVRSITAHDTVDETLALVRAAATRG